MSLTSKFMRTIIAMLVFFVSTVALLGILYVVDVLTLADFKDYAMKVGVIALIISLTSFVISTALALNRKQ